MVDISAVTKVNQSDNSHRRVDQNSLKGSSFSFYCHMGGEFPQTPSTTPMALLLPLFNKDTFCSNKIENLALEVTHNQTMM
jgi:hypothetical protein